MIAIPERLTKNDEGAEDAQKIRDLQEYLDYFTERINKSVLEIGDRLQELETDVALLMSLNQNNGE